VDSSIKSSFEQIKQLRILHFNDVYEITEREEKSKVAAGISRFVTALKQARQSALEEGIECLTLFSGDLISPSRLSTSENGEHMILPFNRCQVDVAMIGNHDLDFGVLQMEDILIKTMKKPDKVGNNTFHR
jgi:5'-nucleotidase